MAIEAGRLRASVALSELMILSPSNSIPGSDFGSAPVATTMEEALISLSPTRIRPSPSRVPRPSKTSMWFLRIRPWTPFQSWLTMPSRREASRS
jgi:hypothetical protein